MIKKGSNLVTLTLQNVESSLTVKCTVYSAHYNGPTIICHQCSSMSNFIVDVFKTWGFTLLRTIMNTNLKPSVFVTTTAITVCTLYGAVSENDFFESSLKLCHLLFMYSKQSIVCYNYSI